MSGLNISAKMSSYKNHVSVNPVNNINVNVNEPSHVTSLDAARHAATPRTVDPASLDNSSDAARYAASDVMVVYPDNQTEEVKKLQQTNEALKIIISMFKNNKILINKLILVDDEQLAQLVKLLTDADEVTIDAEPIEGCCIPKNTYRKVNAIYVIKDGNTKNLKYDYPSIIKELKDLGICTKLVW